MSRFQSHLAKWKRVDLKTALEWVCRYDCTPLDAKYFNASAVRIESGVMTKPNENSS